MSKKCSTFARFFAEQPISCVRGELSEWSKEPHSKCGIRITSYRGFESLTLRKVNEKDVHKRASLIFYREV